MEDQTHLTQRILDLIMEIACLLTGEIFTAVKSGDLVAIMAPSHHFVMPKMSRKRKILEIMEQMIELLTWEVNVNEERESTSAKELGMAVTIKKPEEQAPPRGQQRCPESAGMAVTNRKPEEQAPPRGQQRSPESAGMAVTNRKPEEQAPPRGQQRRPESAGMAVTTMKSKGQTPPRGQQRSPESAGIAVTIRKPEEQTPARAQQRPSESAGMAVTNRKPEEQTPTRAQQRSSESAAVAVTNRKPVKQVPPRGPQPSPESPAMAVTIKEEEEDTPARNSHPSTLGVKVNIKEEDILTVVVTEHGIDLKKPVNGRLVLFPGHKLEEAELSRDSQRSLNLKGSSPETEDKLVKCRQCGQSATMFSDHPGSYYCSECRKCPTMPRPESHALERPFSCAECGRRFANKATLTVHKRYHTGENLHACPECGKKFSVKSQLNRHRKRHTGVKPFACTECSYRSAFKSDFILHYRIHTGEKPFVCPMCAQSFRVKILLQRHRISQQH